jgi:uncharacterized protein YcbX
MTITVETLTRYPIKGLSGQLLESVQLEAGSGFPCDRRFGLARPRSGFDPAAPKPLPKTRFYMLARDERLALLATEFDEASGQLRIATQAESSQFAIDTESGKQAACDFLKTYLGLPEEDDPQLFEATPHRFTDVSVVSAEMMNAVSIINLDSVRDFSRKIGVDVDPRRFRGNILLSGLEPFAELDMIGREISIGAVNLKFVKRTKRCPATEVNLSTGERDIKTPKLLQQHYGHMDMGVYAEVVNGGLIKPADVVSID